MALEDDIRLLASVDLFRDFPEEQLRLLAFGTEREYLPGGRNLFVQGDDADGGYVVAKGQVDIVVFRGQREIILDSCLQGSLIGELALISPNRRIASAIARTNAEVLHIPRSLFHRMLTNYPETAIALHDRISHSVRRLVHMIERVREKMTGIRDLTRPRGRFDAPDQG